MSREHSYDNTFINSKREIVINCCYLVINKLINTLNSVLIILEKSAKSASRKP